MSGRSTRDDRIIAVAFRRSLLLFAVLALIAGAIWLVMRVGERPEVVSDAVVEDLDRLLDRPEGPQPPTAAWRDIAAAAGIDFVHHNGATGEKLLPETMGGGVAVIDHDLDGDPDLLFVDSGPWPWSGEAPRDTLVLYRNDGGRFVRVTDQVGLSGAWGYGMGVAVGDVNGDGRDDLFLTTVGPNRLFLNTPAGFVEHTEAAGVAGPDDAWSTDAAFFDADADGDLDLFVLNYVEWSREIDFEVDYRLAGIGRAYGPPTNFAGTQPEFYRNDGSGRFSEEAFESGLWVSNEATGEPVGKGLAVLPVDLDDDGDLDLFVANDTVRNFAFINDGTGRFEERGEALGLGYDRNGHATGAMGVDAAWLDDGRLAIAVGNFANEMSSLYVGDASGFNDEAIGRGLGAPSRAVLTFGLLFVDYDADGAPDLLQANGHVEDRIHIVQASQHHAQPGQMFWHCRNGCTRQFVQLGPAASGDLARPAVGRGAASADFDGDGRLEIVITQIGGAPRLLKATGPAGRWLRIALEGPPGNPHAIGAQIEVEANGRWQRQWVMPSRSYLSQVEPVATFGLGDADQATRIRVRWPDGRVTEHPGAAAGQVLTLRRD
ncbi:MAG: CRTAC1 family protein [Wenzhouxiangellaceae bacterium]